MQFKKDEDKEATNTKLQNDRPLMLGNGSAVAGRPSCPGRLWDLKLGAFSTHSLKKRC